jgi:hypothetical protein
MFLPTVNQTTSQFVVRYNWLHFPQGFIQDELIYRTWGSYMAGYEEFYLPEDDAM